jgi:hypothetical protein
MNKKVVSISIALFIALIFQGCTTRSGMVQIAMAKKEASKKEMVPEPNTINKNVKREIVEIDDVVTPREEKFIKKDLTINKISEAEGDLIQVEGLIRKEVTELTIDLNIGSNQIHQIIGMRDYVFSQWHYVFDPATGHDTWRSAEATLSLKYKGEYPGDCDDFAILIASFARQIGLKSRVIGAYNGNGSGHAFAEFLVPEIDPNNPLLGGKDYRTDYQGKWFSLDWFTGADHWEYKNDVRIIAQ